MSQDELKHYGILRRSGRYPWGSSNNEFTRSMDFYNYVESIKDALRKAGFPFKDKDIAKAIGAKLPDEKGYSVADLRSTRTIAKEQIVLEQTNRAVALRDKGVSVDEIARQLDIPQPTVRLRLKNSENMKKSSLRQTAEVIRSNVDKHDIVDIGKGTEHQMGIADTRMRAAVAVLRDEGYETYNLPIKQVGGKHNTNTKVLVPPGTGFAGARKMTDRIHTMGEWSEDGGLTYFGIHKPLSVSSNRLKVNFAEDGGTDSDGLIYVRPGVKDVSMGKNTYAQVRIKIDDTHYIKGMAVYKDDLPPGVDLVFNTNKPKSAGKIGALKPLEKDEANPFGSIIKRQIIETDSNGVEKVTSALNLLREEGDWDDWRNSLPSQMLAKQPHSLIKSQLKETRETVQNRLAEIDSITNAVVRKKKLEDFASQIDSDAVDLRAASMPRQRTQVIIPMPKMAKNEIYAPNFETGESVVLIRYPHGGQFEIPEVKVNNNNRTAKKLLGNAKDAIGIHPQVADRLSGADFDGDTVVVIPNRTGKVKGAQSLGSAVKTYDDGLKNFEPRRKYGGYEENSEGKGNYPLMTNTGLEMGMITNLITDMSIQGAKPEHVVKAVRHSMVVIDAEKHKLNYKQSEIDNSITMLKTLYQGGPKSGATTLLSKATAKERIPERKLLSAREGGAVDPETGELRYEPTGRTNSKYDPKTRTYMDGKDGRPEVRVPVEQQVKRLALTNDAYSLVRDKNDPVEKMYADHANEMKAMANAARLKALRTPNPPTNTAAKKVYKDEVAKLVGDLKAAEKQKPLERRADIIAGVTVKAKRQEDPLLRIDRDRLKKVERQAKSAARARLGLTKPVIEITDRQWDAIQSGAVSPSRLRSILAYADPKRVEELSMPRKNTVMTSAISARAKAMLAAGATNADVAAALGISVSTLRSAAQRGDV